MHIVLLVFGAIGAAAFWWFRIKQIGEAASEVADTAGKVRGYFRRKKMSRTSSLSPISAIDDPVIAAATIMTSVSTDESPLTPDREQAIIGQLQTIAGNDKIEEAMIYAKWACKQVPEASVVIDIAAKFLQSRLSDDEKHGFVDMVQSAIPEGIRPAAFSNLMVRLEKKLDMPTS